MADTGQLADLVDADLQTQVLRSEWINARGRVTMPLRTARRWLA